MKQYQPGRKFLSTALSLVMLLGVIPTAALAADTPSTTDANTNSKTTGFENGSAALSLTQLARYSSGMSNKDGGVMEIVDYNYKNGFAYAVNGQSGKLAVIPLNKLTSSVSSAAVAELDGTEIDVKELVSDADFVYGDMTSVAVSPDGSTLAAAVQAEDYTANGRAVLFTCEKDGSLTFLTTIETGVQPDMITFTPDGSKILTANEGEPRLGYTHESAADPAGSVTIIDTKAQTPVTKGFSDYDSDGARSALTDAGIVLKKNTAPSVDLEPEYIACSDTTAYVSLQEANAIAVLNLREKDFTGIYSVGFEDYSRTDTDVDINGNGDGYSPANYDALKGIRMPDGISMVTIGDADYLLTANEGDSRAWPVEDTKLNDTIIKAESDANEVKDKESPTGNITIDKKVTWFDASQYDGLTADTDYLFGGRSFTMFKVTDSGLEEVFDSGDAFEAKTAAYLPDYFNCSNDDVEKDSRSGKKGPEPETVVTGSVDGKTYAFITLERPGGVMVYDITDPAKASFVNYINSRDFAAFENTDSMGADNSPEGLKFVSADKSPTGHALLLAACEVGGTVAAYEMTQPAKIAVISDTHLYDSSELGSTGEAFEEYLAEDRKMLVESEAILDSALAQIRSSDAQYVLISGDLTKDGEKINHELLAEKLADFERNTGKQVFVINGNHDISNDHAVKFTDSTTEKVPSVTTKEFRAIYGAFGYNEAAAKDPNSLSYAVNLGDDYRLIVMDSGKYNDESDDNTRSQQTSGTFTGAQMDWILDQINAAIRDGRRPIGMMHHGLVPHTDIQPTMFPEYLVDNYETVAAALADAGMNLVFTGHFHSQDAAKTTTEKENVLYDVETGSLVTSPCPVRYITLDGSRFGYTTNTITSIQSHENDFVSYSQKFLQSGMEGLVESMLPGVLIANGVPKERASAMAAALANQSLGSVTVKSLLAGAFAAHYAGDEQMDDPTAAVVQGLMASAGTDETNKKLYQMLAGVVSALYTDTPTADRNSSALPLTALPAAKNNGSSSGSSGSSGTASYTVNAAASSNGSIRLSSKRASKGSTVTVTVTPDAGYQVNAVTVTDASGKPVAVQETNGKYTFTMPGSAVSVSAQFIPAPQAFPFTDVNQEDYYYDAVQWAVDNNVTSGTSAVKFSPNASCTRAQMVTFLWRAMGSPEPAATENPFTDVTADAYYSKAVLWAVEKDITNGTSQTTFSPDTIVSRGQTVTFLHRAAGSPVISVNNPFTDVAADAYYAAPALWAVSEGITNGTSATTFRPSHDCTRGQIVTFLYRYAER